MFDNLREDLKRLSSNRPPTLRLLVSGLLSQGFQAILVYRLFNWLHLRGFSGQPLRFFCERFIEITTGISIPACCRIGKGFRIHHFGGIVLHPDVRIGENCTLYQGVTIGDRGGSGGAAAIGDNVLIGAGAKLIGEIRIGNDCMIGANTVLTRDLPDGMVAVGSPCRVKQAASPTPSPSSPLRIMDLRGTYKGGGGPDKTILNSAAQHDPAKVDVRVVYLRQPQDAEFSIPQTAHRLGINYTDFPDSGRLDPSCLKGLRRLLLRQNIRLLHAHDEKTLLYGWLLGVLTPGVTLMYTCHSHADYRRSDFPSPSGYLRFRIRQRMQIVLMKRYAKPIITVSHDTKRRLVAGGLAEKEVAVLHNGIDVAAWDPAAAMPTLRGELGVASGAFLVGTVARITYDKDLPTFYAVAEKVAERVPQALFVIVGDGLGESLSRAQEEVARRGMERLVLFTGHRSDLQDIYRSFDVFLMTSRTEGMPNTLLEAMAMGVPPVSTRVGGIPELLVHGEGGILAAAGDAAALADGVISLLLDPRLRARYGAACRRRIVDHFSFGQRVRKLEDYYALMAGRADFTGWGGGTPSPCTTPRKEVLEGNRCVEKGLT